MTGVKSVLPPLFLGIVALGAALRSPRIADIRPVDFIQIIAAGACFGVALTLAVLLSRKRI